MQGLMFLVNAFYILVGTILVCLAILVVAVTIYAIVQMRKDGFKKEVKAEQKKISKK